VTTSKQPSKNFSPPIPDVAGRNFIAFNQQQLAELLTFIDFADRFTIGFVEINFPSEADILIEALKKHPKCQGIQFVNLHFSDTDLRFLRDEIIKILPTIEIDPKKKLVLLLQGLEKSIGVFGDYRCIWRLPASIARSKFCPRCL
jgi:hypothetical protein